MGNNNTIIEPEYSGNEAEDFVEFFSGVTFLQPWVFRSPKLVDNKYSKEFADVVVLFKDIVILMQVKGNKFDPTNPQRYLSEAKKRHYQLLSSENKVKKGLKVRLKNKYYNFETDFSNVKKIYKISVATGPGEMEIATGADHIDYSKLDSEEVGKYLGFYNAEDDIFSFTTNEISFTAKHLDTLKDFCWYLDFEKKFLTAAFDKQNDKQNIITVVDTNREDMISLYLLHYYWDEELNKTGTVNINKLFNNNDISKADLVVFTATDTRNYLEDDEVYKQIQQEKEGSYFWDGLIQYAADNREFAYKLSGTKSEREVIDFNQIDEVLEAMSNTSRCQRAIYSENIKKAELEGRNYWVTYSLEDGSDTVISYRKIEYPEFPSQKKQEAATSNQLYYTWCRIKYGDKFKPYKDRIKKVLLITIHVCKGQSALTLGLSTEIVVDEEGCRLLEAIK